MVWVTAGAPLARSRLQLGDLGAGGGDQLGVGVGVALQAPAPLGGFGQQDPGAGGQARVGGGGGDEVGELADHRQLLVPVQRAGVGEHLDPDVTAVAVDVGQAPGRELVHETRGVLAEHRDVGYLLDPHHGAGRVGGELVGVGEGAGGGVDIDHGHGVTSGVRVPAWAWAARPSPGAAAQICEESRNLSTSPANSPACWNRKPWAASGYSLTKAPGIRLATRCEYHGRIIRSSSPFAMNTGCVMVLSRWSRL